MELQRDFYTQRLCIDLDHARKRTDRPTTDNEQFAVIVLQGDVTEGVYQQLDQQFFATYEEAAATVKTLSAAHPDSDAFDFVKGPGQRFDFSGGTADA
jgi:hypothetical protein